jgi:hypothetical protein
MPQRRHRDKPRPPPRSPCHEDEGATGVEPYGSANEHGRMSLFFALPPARHAALLRLPRQRFFACHA